MAPRVQLCLEPESLRADLAKALRTLDVAVETVDLSSVKLEGIVLVDAHRFPKLVLEPRSGPCVLVVVAMAGPDAHAWDAESMFASGAADVFFWPLMRDALSVPWFRWKQQLRASMRSEKRAAEMRAMNRLLHLTSDSVEITDTDVRLRYVNPAFEQVTGYTLAEVVGRTTAELFRANTHDPTFYRGIMQALSSEGVWRGSMIARRRDGSLSFQEAVLGAVYDRAGSIEGYVALKRDVHRDALASSIRQGAGGRLLHAANVSAGALVVHTETGHLLEANGVARALFGSGCTNLLEALAEDVRVGLREDWSGLSEGQTVELECEMAGSDGSVAQVFFRTRRMVVAGELFLVSLVLDVTARNQRKELELALAREEALVGTQERLRGALMEKDILLKEVYHRVKNNLQIISSILSLHGSDTSDAHVRNALEDSATRVRAIALVHEKLYSVKSLERIELGDYVGDLARTLVASTGGNVELKVSGDEIDVPLEMAVPCGLIINELITNALKYGRSADGSCSLEATLRQDEDTSLVTVSDGGPGFPTGFNWSNESTLGASLIVALASQLRAKVTLLPGPGGRVRLSIPNRVLRDSARGPLLSQR